MMKVTAPQSEQRMHHDAMQALNEYVMTYDLSIDDLMQIIRTLPLGRYCKMCQADGRPRHETMRWPGVLYERDKWLIASYRCYRCHDQFTCGYLTEMLNDV